MADLFASGRIVDVILALVAVEAIGLIILWRVKRQGVPPLDLLPNLLAGAFLLMALRSVVADAPWTLTAICLAAAGVAHLIDVARRWRN